MRHLSTWFTNRILTTCYNSTSVCVREYHNAMHIVKMVKRAKEFEWNLSVAEELAILFHDSVYIAGGKNNEEMSVALMRNAIGSTSIKREFDCFLFDLKKHDEPLEKILSDASQIILDTITHKPTTVDSCRMIDLDLFELSNKKAFDENTELIYNEYRNLLLSQTSGNERKARKLYDSGRSEWAEKFLDRKQIYYTEKCIPLERKARNNLKSLLK